VARWQIGIELVYSPPLLNPAIDQWSWQHDDHEIGSSRRRESNVIARRGRQKLAGGRRASAHVQRPLRDQRQAEHPGAGRRAAALQDTGRPDHARQLQRIHNKLRELSLKEAAPDLLVVLIPGERTHRHRVNVIEPSFDEMGTRWYRSRKRRRHCSPPLQDSDSLQGNLQISDSVFGASADDMCTYTAAPDQQITMSTFTPKTRERRRRAVLDLGPTRSPARHLGMSGRSLWGSVGSAAQSAFALLAQSRLLSSNRRRKR
jgi:hypothetical protein